MPHFLFSETVPLKNGQHVKAKVTDQGIKSITIQKEDGSTQVILKNQILKIIYHEVSHDDMEKIRKEEQLKLEKQHKIEEDHKLAEQQKLDEEHKLAEQQKLDEKKKLADEKKGKEPKEPKLPEKKFSYLWRSALVPGWGQYSQHQKPKSAIYFFGTLLTAGAWISYDAKYHSSREKIDSQETIFLFSTGGIPDLVLYNQIQNSRKELHSQGETAHNLSIALLSIYLINLADSYFLGPKDPVHSQKDSTLKNGFAFNAYRTDLNGRKDDNLVLQFNWRF